MRVALDILILINSSYDLILKDGPNPKLTIISSQSNPHWIWSHDTKSPIQRPNNTMLLFQLYQFIIKFSKHAIGVHLNISRKGIQSSGRFILIRILRHSTSGLLPSDKEFNHLSVAPIFISSANNSKAKQIPCSTLFIQTGMTPSQISKTSLKPSSLDKTIKALMNRSSPANPTYGLPIMHYLNYH